jgi:hypothetical protein
MTGDAPSSSYAGFARKLDRLRRECRWSRLACFGTSTTAQAQGYAWQLRERLREAWGAEGEIFGYGGMGISLAGPTAMPKVIAYRPDVVLLDFLTGVLPENLLSFVDSLSFAFAESGILPVWVAYPMRAPDGSEDGARLARIGEVAAYCRALGMPMIDLSRSLAPEVAGLLRDHVHPLPEAAIRASHRLLAAIRALRAAEAPAGAIDGPALAAVRLPRRRIDPYLPVDYLPLAETALGRAVAADEDDWRVLTPPQGFRITLAGALHAINMRIGPYSPVLDVADEFGVVAQRSVWDPWCHFERQVLLTFPQVAAINPALPLRFDFRFSATRPDHAQARRPVDVAHIGPMLKLRGIFHQGPAPEVELL